jgi:hypothetical protein
VHRQTSVARLGRIVGELSANRRIRIRSDTLPANVIHIIGAISRAPLLLDLRRIGLRSLDARALLGPILGLGENWSGDQGYQRRSRKQFLHGIVSLASLWVYIPALELYASYNFSMHDNVKQWTSFYAIFILKILSRAKPLHPRKMVNNYARLRHVAAPTKIS